jgi:hypothetical protein
MSESTIAKKNADQNPETPNPGTNLDARMMRSAFTTSEKNPSVTKVIGNVRIEIIGFIKRSNKRYLYPWDKIRRNENG